MNGHIILGYLLLSNLVAFVVYGIDKYKARKGKWRISESTLLMLAVFGGSIGAWLAMKVFHHKTMHKKILSDLIIFILRRYCHYQTICIKNNVHHQRR